MLTSIRISYIKKLYLFLQEWRNRIVIYGWVACNVRVPTKRDKYTVTPQGGGWSERDQILLVPKTNLVSRKRERKGHKVSKTWSFTVFFYTSYSCTFSQIWFFFVLASSNFPPPEPICPKTFFWLIYFHAKWYTNYVILPLYRWLWNSYIFIRISP